MSKAKRKTRAPLGKRIIAGLNDALAHAKGEPSGVVLHAPETVDVKAIRKRQGLSQSEFAARYGFSVDSVQNWEAGRSMPGGPARTLLLIIDRNPDVVRDALTRAPR